MRILSLAIVVWITAFHVLGQTSPHGKGLQIDCSQCHTSKSWKVDNASVSFSHDNTNFKLAGQHKVIDCKACHPLLKFNDTRRNCLDCHHDVHDQTLGKDCEKCHTPKSWIISEVTAMHQQTRFPLLGAHRTVNCADCHKSASKFRFEPLGITCIDCHKLDFDQTTSPNHVTYRYSTNCLECHNVNLISWHSGLINHDFFPLTGGHNVGCGLCHTNGKYEKLSAECNKCHNKEYLAALLPKHSDAGIPVNCESCHSTISWKPTNFNHVTTGYELKGSHKNLTQCSDCHIGSLTKAQPDCMNCHQNQYNSALDHKKTGYPADCSKCHTQNNWVESIFNHSATNYPLTGAHKSVKCATCHTATLAGTSAVCSNCHLPVYNSSQLPAHTPAGLSKDCATCHTTSAWKPSAFNHTSTGYELKGAHKAIVQCSVCHKGNVTSAPQQCVGCHQLQYDGAPGHKQSGFSTDCNKCHTQDNWLAASYDHATTNFPLSGAHTKVQCSLCHLNGYKGTSTSCSSCHLSLHTNAQLPSHTTAGISTDCAACHNTALWKPSTFNHTTTGFELKGAHSNIVQCSQCHAGNLTSAPQTCIGCHQAQYNSAPGHLQNGYSTDCTKCHSPNNWLATSFDHSTTVFPLTGAHTKVLCSACHVNGYANTPVVCSSCHLTVYTSSQLPGHIAAGIPKECATCHSTNSWKPSLFNHTTTGYELKGAHKAIVQCSQCHKGNLTSAPQTCAGCHQSQYDLALNHKVQGYPIDCTVCHSQNNWLENIFNHATTSFPLTNAHTTVVCNKCHTNGFKGTPTLCYTCHTTKYTASTNPNHLSAKFPTNCEICHSTKAWTPSTYNHDSQYFPINSGKHNGKWTLCSECHTNSSNYAVFSCIVCHEHSNKASIDNEHKSVKNYTYTATSCFSCHRTGRAG